MQNGDKVWVRILAGPNSPEALSPGIVTDSRVADREVVRSQVKGGRMLLPNTIVVISYRTPPSRDPFYTERPEQLIGVFPRKEHLPVIDGAKGKTFIEVFPLLRREVQNGLDRLTPAPTNSAVAEAAKEYARVAAIA